MKHETPAEREISESRPILTKLQACELLSCNPRYLERAVKTGRLRALKPTGKFWRVRKSDLEAFLESGATIRASE
jgi:excisionase family DNA binding protein